ncbi:MAG TPA: hypothetical protein PLY66_15820 [Acidobacteriota bacterium]|nr:hypothetical protein [Acidobacteriota bacterium]HQF87071.1 hypothetical protein [Acidobacteriota bacterium]HQG91632.1 hypothetical protein [Acidobacteriota bacterium]
MWNRIQPLQCLGAICGRISRTQLWGLWLLAAALLAWIVLRD